MLKKLLLVAALALCSIHAEVNAQNFNSLPAVYLSAASNNSTLVKTGASALHNIVVVNTTATIYYVRFYDSAAAPTCSSATGVVLNLPVPASTNGAGLSISIASAGLLFQTGLGFCITGGAANNDNTSAATGVHLNISYR